MWFLQKHPYWIMLLRKRLNDAVSFMGLFAEARNRPPLSSCGAAREEQATCSCLTQASFTPLMFLHFTAYPPPWVSAHQSESLAHKSETSTSEDDEAAVDPDKIKK